MHRAFASWVSIGFVFLALLASPVVADDEEIAGASEPAGESTPAVPPATDEPPPVAAMAAPPGEPATATPAVERGVGFYARRYTGKLLITNALVSTAAAGWGADWNDSHIFNENWPGHARFHNASGVFAATGIAAVGLWALWRDSKDPWVGRTVAAAIPVASWGSFFLARAVSGATVDDPTHPVARPLGIPANLLVAGIMITSAVAGFVLDSYWN